MLTTKHSELHCEDMSSADVPVSDLETSRMYLDQMSCA